MVFFCHTNDGQRALADRPCEGDLCDADLVLVCEQFERSVHYLDLVHDRIVDSRTRCVIRHWVMCVVLPRERTLLKYHIREESDVVCMAVIEDTGFLGGAVHETVVVLYRTEFLPVRTKDFVRLLDFREVVV